MGPEGTVQQPGVAHLAKAEHHVAPGTAVEGAAEKAARRNARTAPAAVDKRAVVELGIMRKSGATLSKVSPW